MPSPLFSQFWHLLTRCRSLLSSVFHLTKWGWLLLLAIVLSGCVNSDVGIQFFSPGRGEIFQHIQIEAPPEHLTADRPQAWIQRLERRVADVGGTVQHSSAQALDITIPFANTSELQQKFNQFFDAVYNQEFSLKDSTLPAIAAHLTLSHSNFLLMERQHLTWTIDVPSLEFSSFTETKSVIDSTVELPASPSSSVSEELADDSTVELPALPSSSTGDSLGDDLTTTSTADLTLELPPLENTPTENNLVDHATNPISLPQLQFQLHTPWTVRSVTRSGQVRPRSLQDSKTLIWTLTPGEQNTLEAVFWMPNAIGIGALLIAGLVALGRVLKYPQTESEAIGYK